MRQKLKAFVLMSFLLFLFSCGGYETHVINTVHKDGSITRKVIVKNDKNDFPFKKFRVPVDSTWQSQITFKLNEKEDTVWIFTAEKEFASAEELNFAYRADSGKNQDLSRTAVFTKNSGGFPRFTGLQKRLIKS